MIFGGVFLTIILIRTVILYMVILFVIRIMGKAELSKMSPFQLIVSFMIAELAAIPIESPDVSMITGVTAIFTLLFLQVFISFLSIKSERIKNIFSGTPSIIIDNGEINLKEMKKLRITTNDLLEQLRARGIRFAAASGRAYYTLRENFAPYADRLDYLCENGAFVSCGGKVICTDALDPALVHEIIDCCEALPEAQLVLCGQNRAFHKQPPPEYDPHLQCYYVQHQVLGDLHQVSEPILKVAICNLKDIHATYAALEPVFGKRLNVVVSGDYWMDMMNPQVNKGWALQQMQQYLGVTKEETMAFGDYYNDIQLLEQAGESYVMANAQKEMFAYGKHIAPSNEEYGVAQIIRRVVLGETERPGTFLSPILTAK